jgi:hypothetical protein
MSRISSWHRRRLVGEDPFQLGVAHELGVVLQHGGDVLLLGRWDHRARFHQVGEAERQHREQDAAGHGESERQPE